MQERKRGNEPHQLVQAAQPRLGEVTGPCEVRQTGAATAPSSRRGSAGDLSCSPGLRSPGKVAVAATAAWVRQSPPPPAQAARWAERRAQSGDLGAGPPCAGAREGGGARASSRARGLLEDTARAEGVRDKLGSWRGLMVGPLGDRGREERPFEVMGRKSL